MSDIKTKLRGTVKTIDKAIVGTEKIKDNLINIKTKSDELNIKDNKTVLEYSIDKIQDSEKKIVQSSINQFNRIGEKSTVKAKEDIIKIRDKIKSYKVKSNNNIKIFQNLTNLKGKSIKTIDSTSKITENIAKENIKLSQKIYKTTQNLAKKSIKKLKETSKATVKGTKAIVSSVKTLITLIIAGGWISVIIILIICLFGGVLALFNSNGDDDTEELWKSDIVAVAQSQIGVTGGDPYWSWYGFDERVEWCACFVSWCANQCGYIEKGVIPKFSACTDGITWFKENNEWKDRSDSYYPIKGDIIFFDWKEGNGEQDGVSDHVGIVSKIDINTNTIYTVEGNSGDACKERNYLFDDVEIMGYGTPKY